MTKLTKWKNHIQSIQKQIIENSPEGLVPGFLSDNKLGNLGSINLLTLYTNYFGYMPNRIGQMSVDILKSRTFFLENYQKLLKNYISSIDINKDDFNEGKPTAYNFYFFLHEDLLIHFDIYHRHIDYLFHKTDIAHIEKIITELSQFYIAENKEPKIHVLSNSPMCGIQTRRMELSRPKLDIASNYNDDFLPIHETIFERLNQKNNKGLVLLHGKPGTGKTSYLRFLATSLKKKIIFLPPDMATIITDPKLIPLLMDNRNSILVIEDAEKIIVDRDTDGHSPVSTLLNLADGLLSDCLNIQIICSFNTDLSRVDKALMRKGRLIAKYEFKELNTEKAQQLSDKLGFKTTLTQPMILTDIYNQDEQAFEPVAGMAPVGFNLGKTG